MTDDHRDRLDIIVLAVRYTWALDTKDADLLDEVFTPDASATLRGVECVGRDAIKARVSGAFERFDHTQHLVGNHLVTIDGDDATHRCQLQAQHALDGADNRVIGGYYDDRLVRTPDGWRIAHRVMQQTWSGH